MQNYEELVTGVKSKIFELLSTAAILKPSIEEINRKLETLDCKKNILLVTHQILQENTHARKMLKIASENLDRSIRGCC
jgi:phage shock protein A